MTEQRYQIHWRFYESPTNVWTYTQAERLTIYDAVRGIMTQRAFAAPRGTNADYWLEPI